MLRSMGRAAALALALTACGGGSDGGTGDPGAGGAGPAPATSCGSDGDCAWNEICQAGACARLCTRHGECPLDAWCLETARGVRACGAVEPGDDCTADADCGGDGMCVNGACIPGDGPPEGCLSILECYPAGAYCASVDGGTACIDVDCGAEWNDCARCALGPNGGVAEPGGPLLFAPAQDRPCSRDTGTCPDVAPWDCSFSFAAFSPDNSLPGADLEAMVRFVGPDGAAIETFDTRAYLSNGYPRYAFHACFPADESGRVEGAVYLVDVHTRVSQTLCVLGDAGGGGSR